MEENIKETLIARYIAIIHLIEKITTTDEQMKTLSNELRALVQPKDLKEIKEYLKTLEPPK